MLMQLRGSLHRIVWPDDVPRQSGDLGKYGFWLCVAVAAWAMVTWSGEREYSTAALTCLFYVVGGVGVRQHSVAAAAILLGWHVLGQASDILLGRHLGVLPTAVTILLAANLRSTWIAAKWAKRAVTPESNENKVAAAVWKIARYPFLVIGSVLVAAALAGTVMAVHDSHSASSLKPVRGGASR